MRYAELRRLLPDAEILMGTGNLTELTDADSVGITTLLLGVCSELAIRNVLVVQVSPHTRRTIQEHDAARRIMFAAREDASLPKDYGGALLAAARQEAVSQHAARDRRGGGAGARLRISASRRPRTASMSTTATAITSRRMRSRCFRSSASASDGAARLLSRHRADEGGDSPGGSASATPRTSRSIGGGRRSRAGGYARGCARPAIRSAPIPRLQMLTRPNDADDPRDHRHDDQRGGRRAHRAARHHRRRRGLDHRAVSALDDAGESARGAVRGRELHRRRAGLRRLPDGTHGLADRRRPITCRCRGSLARSLMPSLRWTASPRTSSGRAFIAGWCIAVSHAPFAGFNRAQAAVIEAAILLSRLHMLPRDKVESEIAYLEIAISQDRRSRRAGGMGLADGEGAGALRGQQIARLEANIEKLVYMAVGS